MLPRKRASVHTARYVTVEGGRFRDTDLGPLPVLRRLHAEFGDRVRFVLVT